LTPKTRKSNIPDLVEGLFVGRVAIPPKAGELPENLLAATVKKNENEFQNAQKAQNRKYRSL